MTKAVYVVHNGCLVPSDDEPEARALLAKLLNGTRVVADWHQPRDEKQLRRWWQLMTILADNMPVFTDKRAASDMTLLGCRECDWRTDPRTGEMWPVPRSIAYENMPEDAFMRLWERAKFYINDRWIPIGSDELQAEVDRLFSGAQAASLGRKAA